MSNEGAKTSHYLVNTTSSARAINLLDLNEIFFNEKKPNINRIDNQEEKKLLEELKKKDELIKELYGVIINRSFLKRIRKLKI